MNRKITSIQFDEGSTTITYQEPHEVNEKAVQFKMVIVQNNVIQQHLAEMEEDFQDLLEDCLVAVRNPPEAIH